MYILGITGSQRKAGNTEDLMEEILTGASNKGAEVEAVNLVDLKNINNCTACEECKEKNSDKCERFDDDINEVMAKLIKADGVVLGAPTYVYNVPALMKTFIDRTYPLYKMNPENRHEWWSAVPEGKKAILFSVCEQADRKYMGLTLDALRMPATDLGFDIIYELAAVNFFERKAVKNDKNLLARFKLAGERLVEEINQS